jgi:hypothetical protein
MLCLGHGILWRKEDGDLFSLNFAKPSFSTAKREVQKGIQILPKEHQDVFRSVVEIYKNAIAAHGIIGPILVMLVENKMKIKSRVYYEQK